MTTNRTLTMIKPDAVEKGYIGAILTDIIAAGFTIKAMKFTQLTRRDAEQFYAIHKGKPFFESLLNFMTRGPIVAAILEKDNAVASFRELLGSTNPENAAEGTLRKKYATSLTENAVHGSDSDEMPLSKVISISQNVKYFKLKNIFSCLTTKISLLLPQKYSIFIS